LVLGEAKLIRNPQSRREVVAQALDYARALTGWTYEDLQDATRKALVSQLSRCGLWWRPILIWRNISSSTLSSVA
jgi:hypothetical protein